MIARNILFLLLLPVAYCQAQTEELTTDRPGAGNSPFIVPVKKFQIETGFAYEKENEIRTIAQPTTLFRFALTNNFELRLNADLLSEKEINSNAQNTGLSPVEIGFKTNIIKEKNCIPEISILTNFALLGVASAYFKSGYVAPSFYFVMQNTLSEKFSFGYNLGAEWNGEDAIPDYIYTASLGFDIVKNTQGFIEVYGNMAPQSKSFHRMDAGLTYLILHNLQFDASGGMQLTRSAKQNYFISGGISWRIPD